MANDKVKGIEGVGGASQGGASQAKKAQETTLKNSDTFTGMSGGGGAADVGASVRIKDTISISKEAKGQE